MRSAARVVLSLLCLIAAGTRAHAATAKVTVHPQYQQIALEIEFESDELFVGAADAEVPYENLYAPDLRPQFDGKKARFYFTVLTPGSGSIGPIPYRQGKTPRLLPKMSFVMPPRPGGTDDLFDMRAEVRNRIAGQSPVLFLRPERTSSKFTVGRKTLVRVPWTRGENIESVELVADSDANFVVERVDAFLSVAARIEDRDLRLETAGAVAITPRHAGHFPLPAMRVKVRHWSAANVPLLANPAKPPAGAAVIETMLDVPAAEVDVSAGTELPAYKAASLRCTSSPFVAGQPRWITATVYGRSDIGEMVEPTPPRAKGSRPANVTEIDFVSSPAESEVQRTWLYQFDSSKSAPELAFPYDDLQKQRQSELTCKAEDQPASPARVVNAAPLPPPTSSSRSSLPWIASTIGSALLFLGAIVRRFV